MPEAVVNPRNLLIEEVTIDKMRTMLKAVEVAEETSENPTHGWSLEGIDVESMLRKIMAEKGAVEEAEAVTDQSF